MTNKRKTKAKPVIAVNATTGALEEYSSVRGACIALKTMNIKATEASISKACAGTKTKYHNRYWEYVE